MQIVIITRACWKSGKVFSTRVPQNCLKTLQHICFKTLLNTASEYWLTYLPRKSLIFGSETLVNHACNRLRAKNWHCIISYFFIWQEMSLHNFLLLDLRSRLKNSCFVFHLACEQSVSCCEICLERTRKRAGAIDERWAAKPRSAIAASLLTARPLRALFSRLSSPISQQKTYCSQSNFHLGLQTPRNIT